MALHLLFGCLGSPNKRVGSNKPTHTPMRVWSEKVLRKKRDSKEEQAQVQPKVRNRPLEEEARRLKQGAHRHHRQEAMVCRNPEREAAVLVEKVKKEQASD